jgi:hypothetical protein
MGAHQSKARIEQTTINKTITNVMIKNEASNEAKASALQTMSISDLDYKHCKLQISQTAAVSVKAVSEFSQDMTNELISKLKQEVDNQVDNKMKPESELLAPPQLTSTKTDLKNTIYNLLETNINVENINKNIAQVNALQEADIKKITIDACPGYQDTLMVLAANKNVSENVVDAFVRSCDPSQPCSIGQSIKIDLVAQQLTSSIVKAITDDQKVQELSAKIEHDIAPTAKGVSALTGLSAIYMFGGALCCLIVIIGLFYIWNSDTTKHAINTGANLAKEGIKMTPEGMAASMASGK